jgi:enoyl-CoA hydratase/carnithine racemase
VTLPEIVGTQHALDLLYRGRRVSGEEAQALGLCDTLATTDDDILVVAHLLAADIAVSAPLAVEAIRATMRGDLATRVRAALEHELEVQRRLNQTEDFREGVMASAQRRDPEFKRR